MLPSGYPPGTTSDDTVKQAAPLDEEKSIAPAEIYAADRGRGEAHIEALRRRPILRQLNAIESWMDGKLGIESTGADRIPENERKPPNVWNMMLLWFSMLFSPTNVVNGVLGPVTGLSVVDSVLISIFAAMIASVIPAFTATLSPFSGLRQIAVSRYAFGIWGAKLCGLFNIVVNIGFATIDCIVAGQLITAVSGGTVTTVAGIVILCGGAYIISFFGFRVLQKFEQVSWVITLVLMCITFGMSSRYYTPTPAHSTVSGATRTGAALTYFALVFGEAAAWCSMAGDYYVHYPVDTSRWLIFWMAWIGMVVPTIFGFTLGNVYGGMVMSSKRFSDIYNSEGIGGLILASMYPSGYSKFVCVIYALSFMGNVTAIYYSCSLSIQLWGRYFMAVPRYIWNTLLAAISLGLAWGGRNSLESIITDFLSLLGYWTICFGGILSVEHFYFRPRIGGYDLEGWQDYDRMPLGIAGIFSLVLGFGLSFLGMNQTWYAGPAAKAIGSEGGDVGDYITLAAVFISYPIGRSLELRWVGR